jgi:signal transduction histidine kinase
MSTAIHAPFTPSSTAIPRWIKYGSSWALTALIGWIDYVTGAELSIFALYGLPIFLSVWYESWRSGIAMALVCTVVWWWANIEQSTFTTWWGYHVAAGSRMVLFFMVVVASGLMKARQEVDRARIEALERTRDLEQEIVSASEREQRRIGQDLHDGLCQHLAAIGCAAKSLADDLEKTHHPEVAAAQEIEQLIKKAVVEARDLARGMFPVQMDSAGLSAALEGLAATTTRLTSATVTFTEVGEAHVSDAATAMHLYRIAQESVANAIKHASPRTVDITLEGKKAGLGLKVEDDGSGFFTDPSTINGMGLRTMAYRARLIGATLEIRERNGPGTSVLCELKARASTKPVDAS